MYRENNDLQLLLKDVAAAQVVLAWLNLQSQEAKETYEQLVQAAMYDDSKISHMRVAYGKFKAVESLYLEALSLSKTE